MKTYSLCSPTARPVAEAEAHPGCRAALPSKGAPGTSPDEGRGRYPLHVIYEDRYRDLSVTSLILRDGTPIGAHSIETRKRRARLNDVVVLSYPEAERVAWAILRDVRRRRGPG